MAENTVHLLQYGMGRVGKALLRMVLDHGRRHSLRYACLADSSGLVWLHEEAPDDSVCRLLAAKEDGGRLAHQPLGHRHGDIYPIEQASKLRGPVILVDCTASAEMTPMLIEARQRGIHVVLANKLPLVGPLIHYQTLTDPAPGKLRYEATVGAGLPVIRTMVGLLATGDEIQSVEGCFSGTLGYLFSRLEDGVSYSGAVREAWRQGFTEPDPREDLGGLDVARKALILARHLGCEMELTQVAVEPLFPVEMSELSIGDFLAELPALDDLYTQRLAEAQAHGQTLRYRAQAWNHACEVGLAAVVQQGRLGVLRGPENIVVFRTVRYSETPLTIAGPGAGPEVTAAGLLSDILDIVGKG